MNNQPAFPTAQYADGVRPSGFDNGMPLRDYFAAKALQGMMTDPNLDMGCNTVATLSYKYADAMMEAREA
jgi:hypothetical protein